MRCPDCGKFVSLETAEPEANEVDKRDVDVSSSDPSKWSVVAYASARTCRNCAECGTELKALDWEAEEVVLLSSFSGWDQLKPEHHAMLKSAIEAGDADVDVEENGTSCFESGGGRYKKNVIESTVDVELTIRWVDDAPPAGWPDDEGKPLAPRTDVQLTSSNAASEFEEQV